MQYKNLLLHQQSKIKIHKHFTYDKDPTKLTSQIEKITNYKIRKQNLLDEIKRVENSDLIDKEKQIKRLKKKHTIGKVKFGLDIIKKIKTGNKAIYVLRPDYINTFRMLGTN